MPGASVGAQAAGCFMGGIMRRHLPGFQQIANLNIANKLGLIVIVLAVPICALLFVQYQDRQDATGRAESESRGLDYVSSVMPFLREVQLHRGLSQRFMAGDAPSKANMERTAAEADAALAAITASDKKWGAKMGTTDLVAFLNTEWPKARDELSNPELSNQLHTSVIEFGVFPLISTVATESNLVLDQDLDTRSVIVALTESLPRLTESLSLSRSYGTSTLIARQGVSATEGQKMYLAGQVSLANFHAAEMTRQLETAMAANPTFEQELRPIVARAQTSRTAYSDAVRNQLLDAGTLSPTAAEGYFLLGGSAIDLSNQLLATAQVVLDEEFKARSDAAAADFALYGTGGLIGIVLALGLAVFVSATITRPMTHLAEVADRMSLGELDVDIDVEGTNEIGQLAESLRRMQASLRSAIERLRQRRNAA